jgi:two-component system, NarL family, nitrate/nitrite sensor histidine kinase NarX
LAIEVKDSLTTLFWRRFGRSARAPLDAVRILCGLGGLVPFIAMTRAGQSVPPFIFIGFAAFTLWGVAVAIMPALSWRLDERLRTIVFLIDFAFILLLIAARLPSELWALPYAMLLFLNLTTDFLRVVRWIIIAVIICMLAVFGLSSDTNMFGGTFDGSLVLERGLFVCMAILTLIAIAATGQYRKQFALWADGLLIAGTHARAVPLGFIAQQLATQFTTDEIVWIEGADTQSPRIWRLDDGILVAAPHLDGAWRVAAELMQHEQTFHFDLSAERILRHGEKGWTEAVKAPATIALLRSLSETKCGVSFPVRLSDVSARVIILTGERPSLSALVEAEAASRAVEAVFERFVFQSAWRTRAVAEARLELGADLHDTVLQTMASLRMQIAGLLSRPNFGDSVSSALEDLQTTVSEEQRTFRDILNESRRAAREPVDIVAILKHRIHALGAQWNITCDFTSSTDALMVDADSAVEVEFIIREVVSNAVQHAKAKRLAFRMSLAEQSLMLAVRSLDRGWREKLTAGSPVSSRSLARRLAYLGASAYADESETGDLISIQIPLTRG